MRYSKSNLRNKKRPLLRRLQRIMDKQKEDKEKLIVDTKQIEEKKVVPSKYVDIFKQEKDNIFSILPKRTRLGLYNKRGNREW